MPESRPQAQRPDCVAAVSDDGSGSGQHADEITDWLVESLHLERNPSPIIVRQPDATAMMMATPLVRLAIGSVACGGASPAKPRHPTNSSNSNMQGYQ